ncbi:hypothetical protein [Rhodococcus zopfii]|uniref:hypothetical protein n=1 Tax=Rhodococcus zopfii TaxID=43772 RepID=UPI000934F3A2|nr:hypothetical protein [Rhodococcus zopfii]
MPEAPVKALPVLRAATTTADLIEAAALRDRTPNTYEITESTEANAVRGLNAARLLAEYMRSVGDDELQTGLTDLLGDLHHLSDAIGTDWDAAVDAAATHHQAEVAGED